MNPHIAAGILSGMIAALTIGMITGLNMGVLFALNETAAGACEALVIKLFDCPQN